MSILFVGCGNMGGALVSGMLQSGLFSKDNISTAIPENSPDIEKIKAAYNIKIYHSFPESEKVSAIVFAVKPQILDEVIKNYQAATKSKDTIIISIVAGKQIRYFSKYFPKNKIIRTMPNLNAAVKLGSTVGISNTSLTKSEQNLVENIFKNIGSFYWIDNEEQIDAVTAISGSGPAYYFLFTELLAKSAEDLGLPRDLAINLAIETLHGSGAMAQHNRHISLEELRESVTSKGGTTFAALTEFNKDNRLKNIISEATKAAANRAKELAKV
jgi:pyrroline-5-carboxylate reductase